MNYDPFDLDENSHPSFRPLRPWEKVESTTLFCAKHARGHFERRDYWLRLARLRDGLESCYVEFARSANKCAVKAMREARKYS